MRSSRRRVHYKVDLNSSYGIADEELRLEYLLVCDTVRIKLYERRKGNRKEGSKPRDPVTTVQAA